MAEMNIDNTPDDGHKIEETFSDTATTELVEVNETLPDAGQAENSKDSSQSLPQISAHSGVETSKVPDSSVTGSSPKSKSPDKTKSLPVVQSTGLVLPGGRFGEARPRQVSDRKTGENEQCADHEEKACKLPCETKSSTVMQNTGFVLPIGKFGDARCDIRSSKISKHPWETKSSSVIENAGSVLPPGNFGDVKQYERIDKDRIIKMSLRSSASSEEASEPGESFSISDKDETEVATCTSASVLSSTLPRNATVGGSHHVEKIIKASSRNSEDFKSKKDKKSSVRKTVESIFAFRRRKTVGARKSKSPPKSVDGESHAGTKSGLLSKVKNIQITVKFDKAFDQVRSVFRSNRKSDASTSGEGSCLSEGMQLDTSVADRESGSALSPQKNTGAIPKTSRAVKKSPNKKRARRGTKAASAECGRTIDLQDYSSVPSSASEILRPAARQKVGRPKEPRKPVFADEGMSAGEQSSTLLSTCDKKSTNPEFKERKRQTRSVDTGTEKQRLPYLKEDDEIQSEQGDPRVPQSTTDPRTLRHSQQNVVPVENLDTEGHAIAAAGSLQPQRRMSVNSDEENDAEAVVRHPISYFQKEVAKIEKASYSDSADLADLSRD